MPVTIINNGKISGVGKSQRQYDGSKIPGDLDSWDYMGSDPNEILRYTYQTLSERATTLYHVHPPAAAAVNKLTNYAIGSGLVFRSQPDWEILGMSRESAKEWGMRFQKLIHYLFLITNFYEKQTTLFRTSKIMGDSLLFFDRSVEEENDGLFDLLETGGDYINYAATGTTLGVFTTNGLRRKGLALTDGGNIDFKDANGDQNVIQYYDKLMARQLRGYPLTYRMISLAKNNDRWWDAMLARCVMESTILGYTNNGTADNELWQQSQDLAALAKEAKIADGSTVNEITGINKQIPGGVYNFSGNGEMQFTDLKTPSNNFDKMQTAYIELCGMSTDVAPEVILSKYSTSFTAHKGAFNDFIIKFKNDRRNFSNRVCKPTIIEMAKYLFLNKLIEMPHPDFFDNRIIQEATVAGNYLGPVPGHINPAQEVKADVDRVANAFKLRSDVARDYGNEFDNMIEEWADEEERFNAGTIDRKVEELEKQMAEQQAAADAQPDDENDMTEDENMNDDNNNNDSEEATE